jgi:hypothetical protein
LIPLALSSGRDSSGDSNDAGVHSFILSGAPVSEEAIDLLNFAQIQLLNLATGNGTARAPPWPGLRHISRDRIEPDLAGRNARHSLPVSSRAWALPLEVRYQIISRTDGMPLFVEGADQDGAGKRIAARRR